MVHEKAVYRARVVSSIAATVISLACGTNYVYSAWAPQFADKLHLSATESNLIGAAGNLGMYSLGVPIGIAIDSKGPRPAVMLGAILLLVGYLPIKWVYDVGSGSVTAICFFSFLNGFGGCMAFAAAVKTSAINWPHHRGTATAFPLAAFGLSAFFFSLFGEVAFPGDTSAFLLCLAVGTSGLTFAGFFFMRTLPHSTYRPLPAVPGVPGMNDAQQLRRTSYSEEDKSRRDRNIDPDYEPGRSTSHTESSTSRNHEVEVTPSPSTTVNAEVDIEASAGAEEPETDETSSLMSKSSSLPGDVLVQSSVDMDRSHRVDIRGWALMRNIEFWQLFTIMGILAGIGLMTINNIGHNVNALWKHWDPTADENYLVNRQQMHVSILSVCSFCGRLLSGVGSDFLVKRLSASRVWCLVIAAVIFCFAQVCALKVTNPHLLGLVSGFSGLGYGFLFGVYPSIVAETFGIHGLSQNWGFMTLSPVVSGNIFNILYGIIFDKHSVVEPNGERACEEGLSCYWTAYLVTLSACGLGVIVTLWTIKHQRAERLKEEGKGDMQD